MIRFYKLLFLILSFSITNAFAAPPNDDCGTATVIPNVNNYCSAAGAFTNVGSTASGFGAATCWPNAGNDVWFQFTAVATDVNVTIYGNTGGNGTLNRPDVAIYSGSCVGTINELVCAQAPTGQNFVTAYRGALTIGQTYFIRVDGFNTNTGTFSLCINNYTPPVTPGADCSTASFLCNKNAISINNVTGAGANNIESAGTCMDSRGAFGGSIESNNVWYTWQAANSGTLGFNIAPVSTSDDLDWVLYDLGTTLNCANVKAANAIRCASSSGITCTPSFYITGARASSADLTESSGCPGGADGYVKEITMIAGHYYALIINNFSSANNGFNLSFNGTGTFQGPVADFTINPAAATACGAPASFTFTNASTGASSYKWDFGVGATPATATTVGPHSVTYSSTGLKTVVLEITGPTGCKVVVSKTVMVNTLPVSPTVSNINICTGATGTVTATAPGGTYKWYSASTGGASLSTGASYTSPALASTTTYYVETTDVNGCVSTRSPAVITTDPLPTATATPSSNTICSGGSTGIALTSNVAGSTFTWTAAGSAVVSGFSGGTGAAINQVLTTTAVGTVTYTITPKGPAPTLCTGTPITVIITVNPTPTVSGPATTICSGATSSVTLTGVPGTTTFAWNAPTVTGGITGSSASSGSPIAQTLTNPGTSSGTVTYSVTPTNAGCTGTPVNIVVTVNPKPTAAGGPQTICSGATTSVALTSTTTGVTTFAWNTPTATGGVTGGLSGSGSTITNTLSSSPSTSVETVTYSVTPTNATCVGNPVNVVVTVNPVPTATANPNPKSICSGTSPNITLSSNVGAATFSWGAPTVTGGITGGSAGAGASINQVLTNAGTSCGTVTYSVTPTVGLCAGTPINVVVTVCPIPVVTVTPLSQTICSGATTAINITTNIAGSTTPWTISGGVSGASAGSGASIAQTLTNPGPGVQTESYTVTPTGPAPTSCVGLPVTATVTVNPIPVATATPAAQTICSGSTTSIALSSPVAGTTYSWNTPVVTGGVTGSSLGSGASIAQTLNTAGGVQGTVTYSVTPTAGGCPGAPITVVITVNPIPVAVATPPAQNICSSSTGTITLSTSPVVAGTTFSWTVASGGLVGTSGGTGSSISQTLINNTTAVETGTYTITPTAAGCVGLPITATISVYPIPVVTPSPVNQTICSLTTATINLTSTVAGSTFSWTVSGGGGAVAGSGATISQPLSNLSATPITVTYTITPTGPAPTNCVGAPVTATVVVNPLPPLPGVISPVNYCQNDVAVPLSATPMAGGTLNWYPGPTATVPTPSTATVGSQTFDVSQTVNGCEGPKATITVIINAPPAAPASPGPLTYCQGQTVLPLVATGSGGTIKWYGDAALTTLKGTGSPFNSGVSSTSTFYVIEVSAMGCKSPATQVVINITPKDDAGFSYASSTYCRTGTNPSPAINTPGGSFVSTPAGLVINGSTGLINLSGSTVGAYKIKYTTAGPCPNSDSVTVTITDSPDPTFTIGGPFCQYGTNPSPVIVPPASAGLFSSHPGGMVIDINTGEVDLTLSAPNTYWLVNKIAAGGGCAAVADSQQVVINPTPSVTGPNDTICSGGTFSIPLTNPTAGTVNTWTVSSINGPVSGATGGTGATISQSLTLAAGTTVAGSVTYNVVPTAGSGSSSCAGTPIDVTVIVNPVPVAPAVVSPVVYCQGSAAVALSATGTAAGVIQWYDGSNNPLGTTAPVPSTTVATTLTYYASDKIGSCEGPKTPITVTINATPIAPTAPSPAPYCQGAVIAALTASGTGGTFKWYHDVTLLNQQGTGSSFTPASAVTDTFWVTETKTGCTGPATRVIIKINPKDDATFAYSSGTFCITGANPTPIATLPGGTYSAGAPVVINAGTGLIDLTATGLGGPYTITYLTNGICPNTSTVQITITNSPSATFSYAGPYCNSATNPLPTIAAGSSSGIFSASPNTLVWVNNTTGEINLVATPTGITYTITNFIAASGGCAAATATNTVLINPSPAAPAVANKTYCENDPASPLTATPAPTGTLNWYPGPTGTAPTPSTAVGGTTTNYQVSQTVLGCEGPKATISVTVNPTPAAPTAASPAPYCKGVPVAPLTASGSGGIINWYKALPANAGNKVFTNSPFASGDTASKSYWVTETLLGCEGPATKVDITVNPLDDPGFNYSSGTYCVSGVVNPTPTITGLAGGTFSSSPAGLTLNPVTGQITLASSAPNNYTITYLTNGPCPQSTTQSVSIVTSAIAGFSYGGPYCKTDPNPSPVFVAGASAGTFTAVPAGLVFKNAAGMIDLTLSLAGTYTVSNTITGGGCVPVVATASVTINATPAAPGVTNISYCKGAVALPLTAVASPGGTLQWYNGPAPVGTPIATPTPSTATVGSTNYYVSQLLNGCESVRAILKVTINPLPAAPTASNVSYCLNQAASPLTSNATTPTWYAPITTPLPGIPTPSTATAGVTSYWVTETLLGCEGPKTKMQVTVNFTPAPTTTPLTLCENSVADTLSATGSGAIHWYASLGGAQIPTPTPATTPQGTTTYYATNTLNGCESTPTPLTVKVNAPPAPLSDTVAYCKNDPAVAFSVTPSVAGNTFRWYDGTSTFIGTTAPTPSTTTQGTFTWYVSEVSANNPAGCEGPKSRKDVVVNFTPLPVTSPLSYCFGDAAPLLQPTGLGILWYYNVGGAGQDTLTPSTASGATYYVEETQNNCPSGFASLVVTINQPPNAPQVNPAPICSGLSAILKVANPQPGCTHKWYDMGGALIANADSINTGVLTDTTQYQVEAITSSGCVGNRTIVTQIVNPIPVAPVIPAKQVCDSMLTNISVNPSQAGVIYNWYDQSVGGSQLVSNSDIYTTPILRATTSYYVEAIENGCTGPRGMGVVTVTPYLILNATVTPDSLTVCAGVPVTYTADTTNGNGGSSPSMQWMLNGSIIPGQTQLSYTNPLPVNGDVVQFVYTNTTAMCSRPKTATAPAVTVEPNVPTSIDLTGTGEICKDALAMFSVTAGGTGTSPLYKWTLNGQPTGTAGSLTYSSSTLQNGDTVRCYMTSSLHCPAPRTVHDSMVMIVHNPPVAPITPKDALGCDPLTVDYQLAPNMTYKWSFTGADSVLVNGTSYSHTYHYTDGTQKKVGIWLQDNTTHCINKDSVTVTVYEHPTADFTYSPDVISNLNPVVEVTDKSTGKDVNSWTWDFGDGKAGGSGRVAEHNYPGAGNYMITLKISTPHQCKDSISKTVSVIEDYAFYIPDAFSPNGDGVNDTFSGKGIGIFGYDMWIFDRWGSMIFHTNDLERPWDGHAYGKSEMSQQDVFVYKIITMDYKKTLHEYVGKISLMK